MHITKKKFDALEYIGEGTEGIVRRLDDERAAKLMYDDEFNNDKKRSINVQCAINSDSFIFPMDILTIDGDYKGYIQKNLFGLQPTIEDLNDLKNSILSIKKLEDDFTCLTPYRLLIRDLEPRNSIFYDENLFIIDTSRYLLEENQAYRLIERQNKRLINYFLLNTFFVDKISDFSIFELNSILKKLSPKIQTIYGDIYVGVNCYFDEPDNFSKFLFLLAQELKVETLDNLHEKILKLK